MLKQTRRGKPQPRTAASESGREIERASRRRVNQAPAGPLATWRPQTRADCAGGFRPCPWVSCRHHLWLDYSGDKTLRFTGSADVEQLKSMPYTCSLDAAEDGSRGTKAISRLLGLCQYSVATALQGALDSLKERGDDLSAKPAPPAHGVPPSCAIDDPEDINSDLEAMGLRGEEIAWARNHLR